MATAPTFREALRCRLKLGFISFGGRAPRARAYSFCSESAALRLVARVAAGPRPQ